MAASKDHQGELFDLYQCDVCFNSLLQQRARTLWCNHTFCESCINQLITPEADEITCPKCREPMQAGFLTDLPVNVDIRKVKEREEDIVRNHDKYCTCCLQRGYMVKAGATCQQCRKTLCGSCTEIHNNTPAFRSHQLVAIEPEDVTRGCGAHGKALSCLCLECLALVCADCVFDDLHRSHSDKVEDLMNADIKITQQSTALWQKVKRMLEQAEGMLHGVSRVTDGTTNAQTGREADANFTMMEDDSEADARSTKVETDGESDDKDFNKAHDRMCRSVELMNDTEEMLKQRISGTVAYYHLMVKTLRGLDVKCEWIATASTLKGTSSSQLEVSVKSEVPVLDISEKVSMLRQIEAELVELNQTCASLMYEPVSNNSDNSQDDLLLYPSDFHYTQLFEFTGGAIPLRSPSELDMTDNYIFVSDHRYSFVRVLSLNGHMVADYYPLDYRGSNINATRACDGTLFIGEESGTVTVVPINNLNKARAVRIPNTHLSAMGIVDKNNILISDSHEGVLKQFNMLTKKATIVVRGLQDPQFISEGLVDKEKLFVVTEKRPQLIKVYNSRWQLVSSFPVDTPYGTAVLPSGNILVSQCARNCISEFKTSGIFVRKVLTSRDGIRAPRHIRFKNHFLCLTEKLLPQRSSPRLDITPKQPAVKLFELVANVSSDEEVPTDALFSDMSD